MRSSLSMPTFVVIKRPGVSPSGWNLSLLGSRGYLEKGGSGETFVFVFGTPADL